MEDSDGLTIVSGIQQENAFVLNPDIYQTVNKVSRVVKLFKSSPLKNEI